MTDDKQKLVVITGPTASGKSSLAMELARQFGGEIINADSMQVYRGMDVGTAKVTIMERRAVPHHLIDVVDPDEAFNAAIYRSLAMPLLSELHTREKMSFVVGGTGLYIKTLLGGLFPSPASDQDLRERLHREWEELGSASLHERLKSLDPESAQKIHPNDKLRVIRALEVIHQTNKPLSTLMRNHGFGDHSFRALKICLYMDRERLYDRIDQRSAEMIEAGLARETEALLAKGYSPDLKPMKSLGYRHMVRFLKGEWGLDEAILQLQRDTRRYAKRQLTWFRADPEMLWLEPGALDVMITKIK